MNHNNNFEKLIKAYPMLDYFTDRPFGIENEFYNIDYVTTPIDEGIIRPYCFGMDATQRKIIEDSSGKHGILLGTDRDSWHLETDTSVRGNRHTRSGAELVSPILRGIEGLRSAYNAFQFLKDIGAKVDSTCGFHVHQGVDKDVYKNQQIKELFSIISPIENYFYLKIPGDRKNNNTCKPMQINIEKFLEGMDSHCDTSDRRIKRLWYSDENEFREKVSERYDRTRYHGLNLHSFWCKSTIEFRYHSAILDNIDEAMQWIIFTQFLVNLSENLPEIPEIKRIKEPNKWVEMIYKIYYDFGAMDKIV